MSHSHERAAPMRTHRNGPGIEPHLHLRSDHDNHHARSRAHSNAGRPRSAYRSASLAGAPLARPSHPQGGCWPDALRASAGGAPSCGFRLARSAPKRWTADEDAIVLRMPQREAARQLGRTWQSVNMRRWRLHQIANDEENGGRRRAVLLPVRDQPEGEEPGGEVSGW